MPVPQHRCTSCRCVITAAEVAKSPEGKPWAQEAVKDGGLCTKEPEWKIIKDISQHWCSEHRK